MKKINLYLLAILIIALSSCNKKETFDITKQDVSNENGIEAGKDYLIEGDMMLNSSDPASIEMIQQYYPDAVYTGPETSSLKSIYGGSGVSKWPNGIVYYQFHSSMTNDMRISTQRAMSTITMVCNVRFVERTTTTNQTVVIQIDPNSTSPGYVNYVGYRSSSFYPKLVIKNTLPVGYIIHELMHILGFWHEQQRSNREDFVTVTNALATGNASNYGIVANANEYGKYDFQSVMHYFEHPNLGFTFDTPQTIQRRHLSPIDIVGLINIYGWRKDSPMLFDAQYYLNSYADLRNAFGNDLTKARTHWLNYGIKEGRKGSPVYDAVYYKNANADLVKYYGSDWTKYLQHFIINGITEGRASSSEFCSRNYMARYSDLRAAFESDNYVMGAYHYNVAGRYEGRNGR